MKFDCQTLTDSLKLKEIWTQLKTITHLFSYSRFNDDCVIFRYENFT